MELLKNNLNYFLPFIDMLYNEWKDEYIKRGLMDKKAVFDFYKKYINGIHLYIQQKKLIGCYNIINNTITDVCVIPEMRGKGIGNFLIQNALENLWYYPMIILYCKPHLIDFYSRFGFFSISKEQEHIKMIKLNYLINIVLFLLLMLVSFSFY